MIKITIIIMIIMIMMMIIIIIINNSDNYIWLLYNKFCHSRFMIDKERRYITSVYKNHKM